MSTSRTQVCTLRWGIMTKARVLLNSNNGPVDTGRKLNKHKTFRRRLLNVLCTFNLRPVSTGGEGGV